MEDLGPRVCALPAFWTGILYDEEILDQVSDMLNLGALRSG